MTEPRRTKKNLAPIFLLICAMFPWCSGPVSIASAYDMPPRFDRITVQDGLSQASILCSLQDSKGFLWFGTYDGLNRYDGKGFKVFKNELNNPESISDNAVRCLYEYPNGRIWAGTSTGGLNRYDYVTDAFTNLIHDDANPGSISSNEITAITHDPGGVLWVATLNGLNALHPGTESFVRYTHDENDPASLSSDRVLSLYVDPEGTLWVGTYNGLNRFNRESGTFTHFVQNIPGVILNEDEGININCVTSEKDGRLWVGTDNEGLLLLNTATGGFSRYLPECRVYGVIRDEEGYIWTATDNGLARGVHQSNDPESNPVFDFTVYRHNPYDPDSLSHNDIRSILADESGILWLGTYGDGLCKMNPAKQVFGVYRHEPWNANSLSGSHVTSICEDQEGRIWVGTYENGFNIIDRRTGLIERHSIFDYVERREEEGDTVQSLMLDRNGNIWVGTQGAGLLMLDPRTDKAVRYVKKANRHSISQDNIYWTYEDREGYIWVGTSKQGLNRLDKKTGQFKRFKPDPHDPNALSHKRVRNIYEDSQGRLWLGTNNGLNLVVDREKGIFRHWEHNPSDSGSISNNRVTPIVEDSKGFLWVGTDKGLNRFDPANGTFKYFTEADGLANDAIQGLLIDKKNNLWMSTIKGLSRLDPESGKITNFNSRDGFQGIEFWMNAYFQSREGEMFFGGLKGLTSFFPDKIKKNRHIPPVVLTGFKVMNKPFPLSQNILTADKINLTYRDLFFSFEFAALDFADPSKNQYAYKLEGFDKDWVDAGNSRTATYTNFDHGEFTFRVRASNNDGAWNDQGAAIRIAIQPPFWKTLWFRLLLAGFALVLIYGLFTLRIRSLNAQKKKLNHLVVERTSELEEEITERRQIENELQIARDRLEERVIERTSELEQVNRALQKSEGKVRDNYEKLKLTQQQLLEHVTLLQTMIDSIPACVFYKDLDSRYLGCNTTFLDFIGLGREDVIGRKVSDILGHDVAAAYEKMDADLFQTGTLQVREFKFKHADSSTRDVVVYKGPFLDSRGIMAGMVGFMMDITERKQAEEELLRYQAKLREMSSELALVEERERRRIAVDLHDHLGQALALSKLRLCSCIKKLQSSEFAEPLKEIADGIDLMIKDTRNLTMKISPPILYDLGLQAALEWLTEQLSEKHEVQFDFQGDLETDIENQDIRVILYSVTRELLMNVIKHSRATHARVSVEKTNGRIMVRVEDNGIGLGDQEESIKNGRTGTFGLFSVRERLDSIGGELKLSSDPGSGTQATLVFPR